MNRLYDPCYYCNERTATCHGECKRYELSQELKAKDKEKERRAGLERDCVSSGWSYDKRGMKK